MYDRNSLYSRLEKIEEEIRLLKEVAREKENVNSGDSVTVAADDISADPVKDILMDIEKYRLESSDISFNNYLNAMEKQVLRQQTMILEMKRIFQTVMKDIWNT